MTRGRARDESQRGMEREWRCSLRGHSSDGSCGERGCAVRVKQGVV